MVETSEKPDRKKQVRWGSKRHFINKLKTFFGHLGLFTSLIIYTGVGALVSYPYIIAVILAITIHTQDFVSTSLWEKGYAFPIYHTLFYSLLAAPFSTIYYYCYYIHTFLWNDIICGLAGEMNWLEGFS